MNKNKALLSVTFVLYLTATMFISPTAFAQSGFEDEVPIVMISSAVYFTSVDAEQVAVPPGLYSVSPGPSKLVLSPLELEQGEMVYELSAQVGAHADDLLGPIAVVVPGDDEYPDVYEIIFMSSDGKQLSSIGSYSGIQPRGLKEMRAAAKRKKNERVARAKARAHRIYQDGLRAEAKRMKAEVDAFIQDPTCSTGRLKAIQDFFKGLPDEGGEENQGQDVTSRAAADRTSGQPDEYAGAVTARSVGEQLAPNCQGSPVTSCGVASGRGNREPCIENGVACCWGDDQNPTVIHNGKCSKKPLLERPDCGLPGKWPCKAENSQALACVAPGLEVINSPHRGRRAEEWEYGLCLQRRGIPIASGISCAGGLISAVGGIVGAVASCVETAGWGCLAGGIVTGVGTVATGVGCTTLKIDWNNNSANYQAMSRYKEGKCEEITDDSDYVSHDPMLDCSAGAVQSPDGESRASSATAFGTRVDNVLTCYDKVDRLLKSL